MATEPRRPPPDADREPAKNMAALILSPFCDHDCLFCRSKPRVSDPELEQMATAVERNLRHHLGRGHTRFEISGGDPGEYPDIHRLVRRLKEQGAEFVRLATNGNRLADASLAARLAKSGLDSIRIPLYGSSAEVHERITRRQGSFDRATDALRRFADLGVEVIVNALVVRQNGDDLVSLFKRALTFTDWSRVWFSVPGIQPGGGAPFYVPAKDLPEFVVPLVLYGAARETYAQFTEVPMCVFGFPYPFLVRGGPPDQGLQQPPPGLRTPVRDVPSYRLTKKIAMCEGCSQSPGCEGFRVHDIDQYGPGDLKPFP